MTTFDAFAALNRASALSELGRHTEAMELVNQVLARDPENAEAHLLVASVSISLGNFKQARTAAERAIALDPQDARGHELRSAVLLQLGYPNKALRSAEEAARLSPDDSTALLILSEAALGQGRIRRATQAAQRLVSMVPDEPGGYHCLGMIALHQRLFAKAEMHFRKALEIDPDNFEALNNLGLAVAQQKGRKREAMETFHSAVRVSPSTDLGRVNLHASSRRYLYGWTITGLFVVVYLAPVIVGSPVGLAGFVALVVSILAYAGVRGWTRRNDLPESTRMMTRAHFRSGPAPWFLGIAVAGVLISIVIRLN